MSYIYIFIIYIYIYVYTQLNITSRCHFCFPILVKFPHVQAGRLTSLGSVPHEDGAWAEVPKAEENWKIVWVYPLVN